MSRVVLVDYGLGNLRSVANALGSLGAEVVVSARPDEIAAAERLVLPGVGAFGDGMRALRARELQPALEAYLRSERPFLGICLGMQLLFSRSQEFGHHAGLGVFEGTVARIDPRPPLKIPHVGWSRIAPPAGAAFAGTPLAPLAPGTALYFVHSYAAVAANPGDVLATARYGGQDLVAAVRRGRLLGCQFHPERSGPAGLRLLESFLGW